LKNSTRQSIIASQFYLPALAVMLALMMVPIVRSIAMAFTDWLLTSPSPNHPWVGLDNFLDLANVANFGRIVVVTLVYTAGCVVGRMGVGLGTALLLNREFKGRGIVRGVMIIPWAMPTVVTATVFLVSLDPSYGFMNRFLVDLHLIPEEFSFFSKPAIALGTLIVISIWKYFPFATLMILAELQSIPKELHDAASIDGAGVFRKFGHITWPLIQPVWRVVLILQLLWTVKEFELIYLVTAGGPAGSTSVMGVDIYRQAFRFYKIGTASAEGIILLIFAIVFAFFYFRSLREREAR